MSAIEIHGIEDARAALRAAAELGRAATLVSAPGAAAQGGPAWFKALRDLARDEFSGVDQTWILDCGDAPGQVLAALRAGLDDVVFTGDVAAADKLRAIAAQTGARIHGALPPALDLRQARDPLVSARVWLR